MRRKPKDMYVSRKTLLCWELLRLIYKRPPATCALLAKESGFTISYIEQCMKILKKGGLVKGIRGPGGGYVLKISAVDITFRSVLEALFPEPEQLPIRGTPMHYLWAEAFNWGLDDADRPYQYTW